MKPEHIAVLHDIVAELAQASLSEIADELCHRCALRACDATIRLAQRAQDIVRLKPVRKACAERTEAPSGMATRQRRDVSILRSHRHRREPAEPGCSTSKLGSCELSPQDMKAACRHRFIASKLYRASTAPASPAAESHSPMQSALMAQFNDIDQRFRDHVKRAAYERFGPGAQT